MIDLCPDYIVVNYCIKYIKTLGVIGVGLKLLNENFTKIWLKKILNSKAI